MYDICSPELGTNVYMCLVCFASIAIVKKIIIKKKVFPTDRPIS